MQNTLNILCNIKLYLWISIYKYFFNNHNILKNLLLQLKVFGKFYYFIYNSIYC